MPADREQLETWIAKTRRTQRRLALGLVPAGIAAMALLAYSRALGGLALVSLAIIATFGFWITGGHITDWETKLSAPAQKPELNMHGRSRRERD
jgi:hypothetical protein